jgi:hypothetical protein
MLFCKNCNYTAPNKSSYEKHILTTKHKTNTEISENTKDKKTNAKENVKENVKNNVKDKKTNAKENVKENVKINVKDKKTNTKENVKEKKTSVKNKKTNSKKDTDDNDKDNNDKDDSNKDDSNKDENDDEEIIPFVPFDIDKYLKEREELMQLNKATVGNNYGYDDYENDRMNFDDEDEEDDINTLNAFKNFQNSLYQNDDNLSQEQLSDIKRICELNGVNININNLDIVRSNEQYNSYRNGNSYHNIYNNYNIYDNDDDDDDDDINVRSIDLQNLLNNLERIKYNERNNIENTMSFYDMLNDNGSCNRQPYKSDMIYDIPKDTEEADTENNVLSKKLVYFSQTEQLSEIIAECVNTNYIYDEINNIDDGILPKNKPIDCFHKFLNEDNFICN